MRVCRRWHAVAKAYPALWSTIIFDEFFDFAPLLTVRSDEVYPSLFLDSSAAAPLTLSLSGSGQAHRLPGAHQLVPHLARAESLHLGGSILFSGAVALSQPAPRLKELVLSGSSVPPSNPAHTQQMLFAGSHPSLESLAFVNVPIRSFKDSFQSSYHQLRQLFIVVNVHSTIHTSAVIEVLRNTPNLEDFFLEDYMVGNLTVDPTVFRPAVSLPRLKNLTLDYHGTKEPVMRSLSLPNGILLTMRGEGHVSMPRWGLVDVHRIKRAKLRHRWRGKGISDCIFVVGDTSAMQVATWFRGWDYYAFRLDELEEFWIEGRPWGIFHPLDFQTKTPRLRAITLNVDSERGLKSTLEKLLDVAFCPSLTFLEIRVASPTMAVLTLLCAVLAARRDVGRALRTVRLGRHERMQRKSALTRPRLSYAEWAEGASASLQGLVTELVFLPDGEPVPRMPVPPICEAHSKGWQWPEWDDKP